LFAEEVGIDPNKEKIAAVMQIGYPAKDATQKQKAIERSEQLNKSTKNTAQKQNHSIDDERDNDFESELQLQRRQTFYWKFFSLVNLLLVLGLVTWMFLPKPPPIEVIQMAPRLGAVLQAPGHSATPGWVLSVDPQQ